MTKIQSDDRSDNIYKSAEKNSGTINLFINVAVLHIVKCIYVDKSCLPSRFVYKHYKKHEI